MSKLILDVIEGKKVGRTPIWLMRQAGRYMEEYRSLRANYDFLTMCLTPELAAQVTLQPIQAFDFDAAIIFSDILIPGISLGLDFSFIEGKGPVFDRPVRTVEDIEALPTEIGDTEMNKVGEAIRIVRNKLSPEKAVIGFCGAPFTLACYFVEGAASNKNFLNVKTLLYNNPDHFNRLMDQISNVLIEYLKAQAEAGADIVQIFDTWGGILAPTDFERYSLPFLERIIKEFRKAHNQPVIYFTKGNTGLLQTLKKLNVEVLGVDWTIDLLQASQLLENRFVLQGNLDPTIMLSNKGAVEEHAIRILNEGNQIKGHIFNLGHGILPSTPVENVKHLVETIRSF